MYLRIKDNNFNGKYSVLQNKRIIRFGAAYIIKRKVAFCKAYPNLIMSEPTNKA